MKSQLTNASVSELPASSLPLPQPHRIDSAGWAAACLLLGGCFQLPLLMLLSGRANLTVYIELCFRKLWVDSSAQLYKLMPHDTSPCFEDSPASWKAVLKPAVWCANSECSSLPCLAGLFCVHFLACQVSADPHTVSLQLARAVSRG